MLTMSRVAQPVRFTQKAVGSKSARYPDVMPMSTKAAATKNVFMKYLLSLVSEKQVAEDP